MKPYLLLLARLRYSFFLSLPYKVPPSFSSALCTFDLLLSLSLIDFSFLLPARLSSDGFTKATG